MSIYIFSGTVDVYTEIEADTYEEALKEAKNRPVETTQKRGLAMNGPGERAKILSQGGDPCSKMEHWIVEEPEQKVDNIKFENSETEDE